MLLPHYLLSRNIGGDYEKDRTWCDICWRFALRVRRRWEDCLADPWLEYEGVRRLLDRNDLSGPRV